MEGEGERGGITAYIGIETKIQHALHGVIPITETAGGIRSFESET